jgi:hypothetical protein
MICPAMGIAAGTGRIPQWSGFPLGPRRPPKTRQLRSKAMYRIREVDPYEDEIADTLAGLHRLAFFDSALYPGM